MLMARELATIDCLSEGRLIVGAGAGWVEEEFTSTGVPFADRGGRLNEFVRVLRHLWTKPEEPWNGKFYQVPGVRPIMPCTPGGPPVFIGASNSTGLRRVAKLADGFVAVNLPPASLADLVKKLDEMTKELGRGELPVFCQAAPPETIADAKAMVPAYRDAGIDGIILAKPFADGNIPPEDVAKALLEIAHD
jgi:alkanesulfonate monooxygenase SsuD/methylene tetrahydromethanopterin reductase-like flavin-dependent oxidoreductase (luciferase family)